MPANRLNYLRMLQEVSRPELDLAGLERLIKAEASVCYRLLRYLNSAVFGFQKRDSLGTGMRSRFWANAKCGAGCGWWRPWVQGRIKPAILLLSALVRARFAELLAPRVYPTESRIYFLLGLLSLIDAMLEMPMENVLEKIPLDQETKAVLLGTAQRAASGIPVDAGA